MDVISGSIRRRATLAAPLLVGLLEVLTMAEVTRAEAEGAPATPRFPIAQGHSLAIDAEDNVYVASYSKNRAFRVAPDGALTALIDAAGDGRGHRLEAPTGIAVGADGSVYVAGGRSHNVFRITNAGHVSQILETTILDPGDDGQGRALAGPTALAVDAEGNVYVAAHDSDNAFRIAPAGTVSELIDRNGDRQGHGLRGPQGIAVDAEGNVYVTGDSDNAFRISPQGTIRQIIDAAGDGEHPLRGAFGIAVDGDDNVFVSGHLSHNAFKISDPGGECRIQQIIDATGDGDRHPLAGPLGIAVDADGNAYVAGRSSNNAFRITPDGDITEIIDASGGGEGHPLDGAAAIAVGSSGTVYLTEAGNDDVFRIPVVRVIPAPSWIAILSLVVLLAFAGLAQLQKHRRAARQGLRASVVLWLLIGRPRY